jgi:hypothetical protein
MIRPNMPESKAKYDGPVISRTTAISELELPLKSWMILIYSAILIK